MYEGEHMKAIYLLGILVALIFVASGAMAYTGFNRYYYTSNYYSPVYMPTPAYNVYTTPGYAYSTTYYGGYSNYVYPTYAYPTYVYPAYTPTYYPTGGYTNMSIYSGSNGWGISIGRGSVCGYYGYC